MQTDHSDSVVLSCMVGALLGEQPTPRTDLGVCTAYNVMFEGRPDADEEEGDDLIH